MKDEEEEKKCSEHSKETTKGEVRSLDLSSPSNLLHLTLYHILMNDKLICLWGSHCVLFQKSGGWRRCKGFSRAFLYDASHFDPPAPVRLVIIAGTESSTLVQVNCDVTKDMVFHRSRDDFLHFHIFFRSGLNVIYGIQVRTKREVDEFLEAISKAVKKFKPRKPGKKKKRNKRCCSFIFFLTVRFEIIVTVLVAYV